MTKETAWKVTPSSSKKKKKKRQTLELLLLEGTLINDFWNKPKVGKGVLILADSLLHKRKSTSLRHSCSQIVTMLWWFTNWEMVFTGSACVNWNRNVKLIAYLGLCSIESQVTLMTLIVLFRTSLWKWINVLSN